MGWGKIGDEAAKKTNDALKDRELELLQNTSLDWESLKPADVNEEDYKALMDAVKAATERNENIAQLGDRLQALGSGVLSLAKTMVAAVPK